MRPVSTSINLANSFTCNSILVSNKAMDNAFSQFQFDCLNLFFSKLLGHITPLSTFFSHIYGIISFCARKQMGRVNAERIITFMENAPIIWDRTVGQKPNKPMGTDALSFISKCTIASASGTEPIPTSLRGKLFDFSPKATFNRAKRVTTPTRFKRTLTKLTKVKHKPFIT